MLAIAEPEGTEDHTALAVRELAADALPATLRALEVPGGCAADYDTWLIGATA